jgi:hypothetical protein
VKADLAEPLIYAGVFALLMGIRAVTWWRPRGPSAHEAGAVAGRAAARVV